MKKGGGGQGRSFPTSPGVAPCVCPFMRRPKRGKGWKNQFTWAKVNRTGFFSFLVVIYFLRKKPFLGRGLKTCIFSTVLTVLGAYPADQRLR